MNFRRLHPYDECVTDCHSIAANTIDEIDHHEQSYYAPFSSGSNASISMQSKAQSRAKQISEMAMSLPTIGDHVKNAEDVAIITDDDIYPTTDWNGTFYFTDPMQAFLKNLLHKISPTESYVWPHVMRRNSAIIIDEMESSITASLPVLCARVLVSFFSSKYV